MIRVDRSQFFSEEDIVRSEVPLIDLWFVFIVIIVNITAFKF